MSWLIPEKSRCRAHLRALRSQKEAPLPTSRVREPPGGSAAPPAPHGPVLGTRGAWGRTCRLFDPSLNPGARSWRGGGMSPGLGAGPGTGTDMPEVPAAIGEQSPMAVAAKSFPTTKESGFRTPAHK